MYLFYEIENLKNINSEDLIAILDDIEENISCWQLRKLIDYFILNLKADHDLPGSEYQKLIGIGNWIKENNHFTSRQFRYSLLTMSRYSSEIDVFR